MYKVRFMSKSGREFETIERWQTRAYAKEYIRAKRKEPGWTGLRWWTVPA